jgi:hypothetical protein
MQKTMKIILAVCAALSGFCAFGSQIIDFGINAPTPGPDDVAQLVGTATRMPDGLNYYSNNGDPPGQTFTTGSNPNGYTLNALYVNTGGFDSSATATAQTYTLRIYSVSGATATLVSTYVTANSLGFPDGDWLEYTGLTNILDPNTVYAYSHHNNGPGWDGMNVASGSPYSGGELGLFPAGNGAITFGASQSYSATFVANLEGLRRQISPYMRALQ